MLLKGCKREGRVGPGELGMQELEGERMRLKMIQLRVLSLETFLRRMALEEQEKKWGLNGLEKVEWQLETLRVLRQEDQMVLVWETLYSL